MKYWRQKNCSRTEKEFRARSKRDRSNFGMCLSTIRDADMIIYMKDGDIKEIGTHDELISQNGMYAELYNSQFITN